MKKELVKFGFVVFAAVAMAACGGAKEETTETAPETPATTEPAPVEEVVEPAPADTMAACDAAPTEEAHH